MRIATFEFPVVSYGDKTHADGYAIVTNMGTLPEVGTGKAAFHIPGHKYSSSYSIENMGGGWYKIDHDSRGGALFVQLSRAPWGMMPVCRDRIDGRRVATLGLHEESGNYCISKGLDWYLNQENTRENGGILEYFTVPETLVQLASLYIL